LRYATRICNKKWGVLFRKKIQFNLQMTLKNAFKVKFKVTNFFVPQNYTIFLSCVFGGKCFLFANLSAKKNKNDLLCIIKVTLQLLINFNVYHVDDLNEDNHDASSEHCNTKFNEPHFHRQLLNATKTTQMNVNIHF